MLMITRKAGQSIMIDGKTEVIVHTVSHSKVMLGIVGDKNIPVMRTELLTKQKGNPQHEKEDENNQ